VHTVRVFFACGGNASRAARELFVHLNTMVKRLDRVAKVLGEDWLTEHRSLPLRLALHLHDVAEASSTCSPRTPTTTPTAR
jgi:DNA-binding PucR family transcriptional regulator